MSSPYLSLTAADREAMLEAIGVSSVEELFREIPEAVRFRRELALEPQLGEAELTRHLEELAAKNSVELSFLGAGMYDHYVPAIVDAVLQRGELLTAYTPYQPEMSQGVLQAIFEYQTAICELTGMDVSNASGYDGTTVAADACYVAKHATSRTKVVVTEATSPQVRQVVKTYAPGFGLDVVEVPQTAGATDPDALAAAAADAAAVIFQQPNFFGVLEPAPELAAIANDAGALAVAHVDPISLGVLEAPGNYGCSLAIGEGQGAGNFVSFGGPHYGFLAAKSEFIRRLPGRIIGETTDLNGERAYVLTLQTREQHIRREKATSNITTNQTLLALGGLVYLSWLGPQGLRELGETCMGLSAYAKERLGLPLVFPERTTFKEFAVRVGRPAREVVKAARERGVHPGYALGRDYPGLDDALLIAVTEKRSLADIDRLAEVLAEVARGVGSSGVGSTEPPKGGGVGSAGAGADI
jgi:glycine dehydrogenase subunit 1